MYSVISSFKYLEKRTDINIIAKVRKPARDDLPASVMSVLSHFCNLAGMNVAQLCNIPAASSAFSTLFVALLGDKFDNSLSL